jgi:hypothetical protein
MGISISLLFAERSLYSDVPPNSANKWQQPTPNNPNPNLTPRDGGGGPFYADGDEFHRSEILAIVSSALNWLVATAL